MDRIIRAAGDGAIKMAVINAHDTVERARQIHGCAPTACAALGRTLCAASLMGQDMKEENAALTIRINGNGPLGGIVAVNPGTGTPIDAIANGLTYALQYLAMCILLVLSLVKSGAWARDIVSGF